MGEAKRRKSLDPNYGRAGHTFRDKARIGVSHLVFDLPFSLPETVTEYERSAQSIVDEHRVDLLEHAAEVRAENDGDERRKNEELCLFVPHSPRTSKVLKVRFCYVSDTQVLWRRELRRRKVTGALHEKELFAEARAQLDVDQFLWAHLEIGRSGVYARLIPIRNSGIAQLCRLPN